MTNAAATLDLGAGEHAEWTLPGRGGAGYQWTATIDDPSVVAVTRLGVAGTPPGPYAGGERFRLDGLAPGETIVRFREARSFAPAAPLLATLDLRVRVTRR